MSLTLIFSASTWPNIKSKVSFEILRTSRFQNWPYFLNLVKIWGSYCQKQNKFRNFNDHPLVTCNWRYWMEEICELVWEMRDPLWLTESPAPTFVIYDTPVTLTNTPALQAEHNNTSKLNFPSCAKKHFLLISPSFLFLWKLYFIGLNLTFNVGIS